VRALALSIIVGAILLVSGCGSGDSGAGAPDRTVPGGLATEMTQDHYQDALSTQKDVESFAVRLEQVFASSSYPTNLAGVVAAAKTTGLHLSVGDSLGGYKYDASDREFQLCVQNKSGAYAIYDTSPMSVRSSGDTGGCPFG
jgi:hypothetical protein